MASVSPTPIRRDDPATLDPKDRTPQQVADLLRRPFHPDVIKQRPVAGGLINYVPIDQVIHRLNRACDSWNWEVTDICILTMPIKRKGEPVETPVIHVTGTLEIPGLGARQAVGTSPCEGTEDAGKIAESDALKRAATMFSVPGGR